MKAVCNHSAIPLRSTAAHTGELLSQILFGELLEIIDRKGRAWYKVRCVSDNNFGWVSSSQILPITDEEFQTFKNDFAFALDLVQPIRGENKHYPIPIGARLPVFDGIRFRLGEEDFHYSGRAVDAENLKKNPFDLLPKITAKFLNAPEMKGGKTPLGIDSAGLVQLVFGFLGFMLPRYPDLQVDAGKTVDFAEQMQVGDIAFFKNRKDRITHCGIILDENQIIHASGKVRIDVLDHFGIYNSKTSKYTHKLRIIKRLLPKLENGAEENTETTTEEYLPKALFDI